MGLERLSGPDLERDGRTDGQPARQRNPVQAGWGRHPDRDDACTVPRSRPLLAAATCAANPATCCAFKMVCHHTVPFDRHLPMPVWRLLLSPLGR